MKLSTLYTAVPEYIEFGWVTTPNQSGQSISANIATPLILNSEVADTGNFVVAPLNNRFTLPAGSYFFEATTRFVATSLVGSVFILYNVTNSNIIARSGKVEGPGMAFGYMDIGPGSIHYADHTAIIDGQFQISNSNTFELQLIAGVPVTIQNGWGMTNSTANADQRTTIKLWKLK